MAGWGERCDNCLDLDYTSPGSILWWFGQLLIWKVTEIVVWAWIPAFVLTSTQPAGAVRSRVIVGLFLLGRRGSYRMQRLQSPKWRSCGERGIRCCSSLQHINLPKELWEHKKQHLFSGWPHWGFEHFSLNTHHFIQIECQSQITRQIRNVSSGLLLL